MKKIIIIVVSLLSITGAYVALNHYETDKPKEQSTSQQQLADNKEHEELLKKRDILYRNSTVSLGREEAVDMTYTGNGVSYTVYYDYLRNGLWKNDKFKYDFDAKRWVPLREEKRLQGNKTTFEFENMPTVYEKYDNRYEGAPEYAAKSDKYIKDTYPEIYDNIKYRVVYKIGVDVICFVNSNYTYLIINGDLMDMTEEQIHDFIDRTEKLYQMRTEYGVPSGPKHID